METKEFISLIQHIHSVKSLSNDCFQVNYKDGYVTLQINPKSFEDSLRMLSKKEIENLKKLQKLGHSK